ncbi:g8906 [Coccomyxa elongata]
MLAPRRGMATKPGRPALAQTARLQKRASEQGLYLVAMVVGMVGLTYASVPLYRMFCQATGFGGTVKEGRTVEEKMRQREERRDEAVEVAAAERQITVSFNADVSDGMPWRFVPAQRSVKVHPGQSTLIFYTAHNLSDKAITGVSTYNVAPQQAGYYFNKIQCFCFEEQKLRPGEKIDMPVFFYIDPEFATDDRLKSINHLTLSYTFFNVEEEEVDVDGEVVPASALIGREHASPVQTAAAG